MPRRCLPGIPKPRKTRCDLGAKDWANQPPLISHRRFPTDEKAHPLVMGFDPASSHSHSRELLPTGITGCARPDGTTAHPDLRLIYIAHLIIVPVWALQHLRHTPECSPALGIYVCRMYTQYHAIESTVHTRKEAKGLSRQASNHAGGY